MENLIIANWKMNPTSQKQAKDLFNAVRKGVKSVKAEVVICPPFVYLPLFKGLTLGSQNCSWQENGAYTGEVSPAMLKDFKVEYVIIGHSERRKNFNETDEIINKKINIALASGLKIIFCIGETKADKEGGRKNEVLERQIKQGLLGVQNLENVSIAYEPVWAIGTEDNCSIEETKESIDLIRGFIPRISRVLYGGSVKSENSGDYIKNSRANGLLVGGSSLNAEEFIKIVKSAN